MKPINLQRILTAILLALALGVGSQSARAQSCCLTFTAPSNMLSSYITDYYPDANTADSVFTLTVSNSSLIAPGVYATWCVDALTSITPVQSTLPGTFYTGALFSTCDSNELALIPNHGGTPPVGPPPVTSLTTWNEINYIINHRAGYFYWDVQVAINSLVGGPAPGPSPPYPPVNPANVQAILSAAAANATTWAPQCGDKVGVIYVVSNAVPEQILLIEVPCCHVTFTKCPTNITLPCNPTTIPDATNPVDTNVVAASSCCSNHPVTITSSSYTTSAGCQYTRLITYTASDTFSNTAICVQMINWTVDTNAPVIILAPTNMNLGCSPSNLPTVATVKGQVTASDTCSSTTINVVQSPDSGTPCAMSRKFTITVSDACGNVSQPRYVTYTWSADTNAPVITSVPAGGYLGCNPTNLPTDASVKVLVKATDNCGVSSTNVTHSDITNGCTITRMFFVTATDACGNTSPYTTNNTVVYSWTSSKTPPVVMCPPDITISNTIVSYCTYTPCDFGGVCNGSNAASILTNCFKKVYTNGFTWCGVTNFNGHCIKFTSGNCAHTFENCVGNPGCLKTNYTNPAVCEAGAFAGHVLCLKLNVDFGDDDEVSGYAGGCGDLVLNDPTCPLHGKSCRQILDICHSALGGCDVSSYGCNISNLTVLCSNLNQSFEKCHPSSWCLCHLVPPSITNVPPSVTGTATAKDGCGGTLPVTYKDVITGGTCAGTYTIARTWSAVDGCGNSNYCTQIISVGDTHASVCGYVFKDCNGDGILTPGIDDGISNVLVTLKNSSNVVVGTNYTDASGAYCFYNLTPGTYTASIAPPTNHVQTGGCHTNHWIDNSGQDCWNENDGNQHCKPAGGCENWIASDGCQHSKNSYGQDCWKDKYGYQHTQNCTYTSCNVPKGDSETFCLAACESKNGVNFAYTGVAPKCSVCVTGPSKGTCGQWITYTCTVTNTGTACFTGCQVSACGNTYTCPSLKPGEGCSIPVNYQCQWQDYGGHTCQATASCNYHGSSNPCTAQASCTTPVGWW